MKTTLIQEICTRMDAYLTEEQMQTLQTSLRQVFQQFHIPDRSPGISGHIQETNTRLLNLFLSAKKIEGCSENTLAYYSATLLNMVNSLQKNVSFCRPSLPGWRTKIIFPRVRSAVSEK